MLSTNFLHMTRTEGLCYLNDIIMFVSLYIFDIEKRSILLLIKLLLARLQDPPECTKTHLRASVFPKIFWGGMPPDPPSGGGPKGPPGALVGTNI